MDECQLIEVMVEMLARGDELPNNPPWIVLRDRIAQGGRVSAEKLENYKRHTIGHFFKHRIEFRKEQLEKEMEQNMASLLLEDTDPIPTPADSTGRASIQPGQDRQTSMPEEQERAQKQERGQGQEAEQEDEQEREQEESMAPTDDIDSRSPMINICVGGQWHGAAQKSVDTEESFISRKMVDKYHLNLIEGQIRLTWMFHDSATTHVTTFFVNESMRADFQLGSKCCDPESAGEARLESTENQKRERRSNQLESVSRARNLDHGQRLPTVILDPDRAAAFAASFYVTTTQKCLELDTMSAPFQLGAPPIPPIDEESASSISNRDRSAN